MKWILYRGLPRFRRSFNEVKKLRGRVRFSACAIIATRDAFFGIMRVFEVMGEEYFRVMRTFRVANEAGSVARLAAILGRPAAGTNWVSAWVVDTWTVLVVETKRGC
jgi:hypothetical protein